MTYFFTHVMTFARGMHAMPPVVFNVGQNLHTFLLQQLPNALFLRSDTNDDSCPVQMIKSPARSCHAFSVVIAHKYIHDCIQLQSGALEI
jgi:hypothetical protein